MGSIINPYVFAAEQDWAFVDSFSVESRGFIPTDYCSVDEIVVVMHAAYDSFNTPSSLIPSGWSSCGSSFATSATLGGRMTCAGRRVKSSDTSTVNFSGSGNSKDFIVGLRFTPPPSAVIEQINSQVSTGNPTSQTKSVSTETDPLVVLGAYTIMRNSSTNLMLTDTFSPSADGDIDVAVSGSTIRSRLAYKIYNSSPANVTIDLDDDGEVFHGVTSFVLRKT